MNEISLQLFISQVTLAWRQLVCEKVRFLAALAGVTFGVLLMMFQLGLYWAILDMVARPLEALNGELVILSTNYEYFGSNSEFSRRRLLQAKALPEVADTSPLYGSFMRWRNPDNGQYKQVYCMGIDPGDNPYLFPGVAKNLYKLTNPENILFDAKSSKEFGDIEDIFSEKGIIHGEIQDLKVKVKGLFRMGQTLAANGHAIMGVDAYMRLMPNKSYYMINIGIVRLQPGVDVIMARDRLAAFLADDVQVLTKAEFVHAEQVYWRDRTPVGFVTVAGLLVAMIVGGVVVYQILYTDINDHLHEYATLKAIGWQDNYFFVMIMVQAVVLLLISFLPGSLFTVLINYVARTTAGIPAYVSPQGIGIVFLLASVMCVVAAVLAIRRLRNADPADLF